MKFELYTKPCCCSSSSVFALDVLTGRVRWRWLQKAPNDGPNGLAAAHALARAGIAFVASSPLGGFPPLEAPALARVAAVLETTQTEVALTWLLARSPNILPIPSTREIAHLQQNLEAGARVLGPVEQEELDRIGGVAAPEVDL